jgi:hypothetical protein
MVKLKWIIKNDVYLKMGLTFMFIYFQPSLLQTLNNTLFCDTVGSEKYLKIDYN